MERCRTEALLADRGLQPSMRYSLNVIIRLVVLLLASAPLVGCDTGTRSLDTSTPTPAQIPIEQTAGSYSAAATAVVYRDLAGKNVESGHYTLAFENYSKAIRVNPGDNNAYLERGFAHLFVEEYDKARGDFDQADKLGYQDTGYLAYVRGLSYLWEDVVDKAVEQFSKSIQLSPQATYGYDGRAQAYTAKGKYDEAIADLTQALQLDPKYKTGHIDRGVAYGHKGDYTRALTEFDQVFKLEKDYPGAYLGQGEVYAMMGEKEKARVDISMALGLSHDVRLQKTGKQQLAALNQK